MPKVSIVTLLTIFLLIGCAARLVHSYESSDEYAEALANWIRSQRGSGGVLESSPDEGGSITMEKRSCLKRGFTCAPSSKCCKGSVCRCNMFGSNCRCERAGLLQALI